MKHTKRFLLTLALAFTGMLASWAQDEVTVNTTANANEWTLQMPDADVELEVTYYTDEEAPFIDGVELTANSDGTWSLAEMPGFDIELEVEYYTDEEVNQMAADEVITKINAIGTVEYTDACKALIDAAREAYDALTDAQKALVSEETLKVLTDAEAAYAEQVAAHKGDANNDGKVNVADIVVIQNYISDKTTPIHSANADVTGDGNIDENDVDAVKTIIMTPKE